MFQHFLQVLENNPKFWNTFASKMDLIDESTIDLFSQNARFFVQVIQKADEERVAHSPTIEKFSIFYILFYFILFTFFFFL